MCNNILSAIAFTLFILFLSEIFVERSKLSQLIFKLYKKESGWEGMRVLIKAQELPIFGIGTIRKCFPTAGLNTVAGSPQKIEKFGFYILNYVFSPSKE